MMTRFFFALVAALAFTAQAATTTTTSTAAPSPTSSFVSCKSKVPCDKYNTDPKTGGIMRCKPRTSTTQPCTVDYCCAKPPSYVRCNTVVTCMPGSQYKTDPKTGGVMRCKPAPSSTQHCSYDYCCEPFYGPTN